MRARLLPRAACALVLVSGACAGVLRSAGPVHAQPGDPQRRAAAQALYDEAGALMERGAFTEACRKLEEVVRLEPEALGAKRRLAACYEGAGRFASAWSTYLLVESLARASGRAEHEEAARRGAEATKARLSRLRVVVPDEVARLEGLTVERDGTVLGPPQWGVPIPVDGGPHVVKAAALGKVSWRREVSLAPERDEAFVEIPPLRDARPVASASAPAPAAAAAPPAPGSGAARRAPEARTTSEIHGEPTATRTPLWVWIAGGTGLASIAAGIVFRVDQAVVEDRQRETCGEDLESCGASYDPEPDNARKQRDFGLFIGLSAAGAIAVSAAAIGFVVSARRSTTAPVAALRAGPWWDGRDAGLLLRGRF